jgi:hypothetical protein
VIAKRQMEGCAIYQKAFRGFNGGAVNRFSKAFLVLLMAFLISFSWPYCSRAMANDDDEKTSPTAEMGQYATSGYGGTASGLASAGAGAATGLKELAFSAIIVGVVVMGALLAASAASDAGPIPTTSHHP